MGLGRLRAGRRLKKENAADCMLMRLKLGREVAGKGLPDSDLMISQRGTELCDWLLRILITRREKCAVFGFAQSQASFGDDETTIQEHVSRKSHDISGLPHSTSFLAEAGSNLDLRRSICET